MSLFNLVGIMFVSRGMDCGELWCAYARNSGTSWKMFSSLMMIVCRALGSETYRMGA